MEESAGLVGARLEQNTNPLDAPGNSHPAGFPADGNSHQSRPAELSAAGDSHQRRPAGFSANGQNGRPTYLATSVTNRPRESGPTGRPIELFIAEEDDSSEEAETRPPPRAGQQNTAQQLFQAATAGNRNIDQQPIQPASGNRNTADQGRSLNYSNSSTASQAENIQIILDGKVTCRLHRKSPNEHYENS
jgi:hypothetical protein